MPSSNFLPIDDGCRPIIDYWHNKCHRGDVYGYHYENLAMASSATVYLHIKTGAKDAHIQANWSVLGGTLQIQWFGAPTVGTAGTVITTINRNRNFRNNQPQTLMYVGSTVSTVGTVLFGARTLLGSSTAQDRAGSNIAGQAERILIPNQDYIVRFVAIGVLQMTADGLFYEETP